MLFSGHPFRQFQAQASIVSDDVPLEEHLSRARMDPVGSIASYRTVAPEGHAIIYLDRHRRWLDNRRIDSRSLGRRHAVLLVHIAQRRRRFPRNVDRVQDVALGRHDA
jgi:hypothetical protein